MTLDEFRAEGALVSQWREVLNMPITQLVLSVMARENPTRRLIKGDISPTYASVRLGHQAGWAEYDTTLTEALLTPPAKTELIEPSYENPEEEEQSSEPE